MGAPKRAKQVPSMQDDDSPAAENRCTAGGAAKRARWIPSKHDDDCSPGGEQLRTVDGRKVATALPQPPSPIDVDEVALVSLRPLPVQVLDHAESTTASDATDAN